MLLFQNFYLIDAQLCGLLTIITSRRLLYFVYKEVTIGFLLPQLLSYSYQLIIYCFCVSVSVHLSVC